LEHTHAETGNGSEPYGARFTVRLPLAPQPQQASTLVPASTV
jgi:hypothetical protein